MEAASVIPHLLAYLLLLPACVKIGERARTAGSGRSEPRRRERPATQLIAGTAGYDLIAFRDNAHFEKCSGRNQFTDTNGGPRGKRLLYKFVLYGDELRKMLSQIDVIGS